ncbi:hypothetical protein BC833DRAFT_602218 [Globomyces pollinis-pini]|nr:hypothetical protein BC833DRAFT_602218 [Globomyces pollinis-pini]
MLNRLLNVVDSLTSQSIALLKPYAPTLIIKVAENTQTFCHQFHKDPNQKLKQVLPSFIYNNGEKVVLLAYTTTLVTQIKVNEGIVVLKKKSDGTIVTLKNGYDYVNGLLKNGYDYVNELLLKGKIRVLESVQVVKGMVNQRVGSVLKTVKSTKDLTMTQTLIVWNKALILIKPKKE